MLMQQVVSWICVAVFATAAVITLLAITNVIKLASNKYRDRLFAVLVVQIVTICVGIFSGFIKSPKEVESLIVAEGRQQVIAELKPEIDRVTMLAERLNRGDVPPNASERLQLKNSLDQLSQSADRIAVPRKSIR